MLPILEEQDKKLSELLNEHYLYNLQSIANFTKEYAKWLCTEVIKHCAEVAEVEFEDTYREGVVVGVNKQSILNVIKEINENT